MIRSRILPLAPWVAVALALLAPSSHARTRLGFEGGFRYGDMTRDDLTGIESTARPAWSLGAVAETPLGAGLALVTGARYLEHRDAFGIETGSGGSTSRLEYEAALRYLTFPVHFSALPAGGLVFEAGADFGYLIDSDRTFSYRASPPPGPRPQLARIFEELGTLDDQTAYRRWNVAATAGAGWDFRSASRVLTLRLRYERGLTNQHRDVLTRHTRAFALDAGVRW